MKATDNKKLNNKDCDVEKQPTAAENELQPTGVSQPARGQKRECSAQEKVFARRATIAVGLAVLGLVLLVLGTWAIATAVDFAGRHDEVLTGKPISASEVLATRYKCSYTIQYEFEVDGRRYYGSQQIEVGGGEKACPSKARSQQSSWLDMTNFKIYFDPEDPNDNYFKLPLIFGESTGLVGVILCAVALVVIAVLCFCLYKWTEIVD
ncbi:expressed unknown protein [Seminavis robusta]|uniref:DUF3592 domain-containing protein n=1 Tax=Seminavis robusta TaxID=568900 RepID=A0A9N8HPL9_9STRA|nr:expressed unknown protein [Seminavis robusta]|eukprot:Sro1103_g241680.1 n/a (208) ;mRNA; f:11838-12461